MKQVFGFVAVSVVAGTMAFSANAAQVIVHQTFGFGDVAGALGAESAFWGSSARIVEDFEGFDVLGDQPFDQAAGGTLNTSIGTFQGLGGPGSGGTVAGQTAEQTNSPQIRSGNVFGRQNITAGGANWLDSNDTLGFTLTIDTIALGINPLGTLSFFITDAGDQGATFQLSYGGESLKSVSGRTNGDIDFFVIRFDAPTQFATLTFSNTAQLNDGFGVDNFSLAPIPIPPAVAMLLTGLAGLGFIGRRRKAAA